MDAFKQPQLGQMIQSLRLEKKLTQEELVEMCNLNVRTLQRIEAGEVVPRDYTIRAILSALEYELDKVEDSIKRKSTVRSLSVAWIAGVVYFILGLVEAAMEYYRFEVALPVYFPLAYTGVKSVVAASYALFIYGFVVIGKNYKSSLLQIGAFLMLGSMIIIELYDIVSIYSDMSVEEFWVVKGAEGLLFGGVDIVFGIALFRLGEQLGLAARIAGVVEIVMGLFFLTILLAIPGLFLSIPVTILEIVILYKSYDLIRTPNN